MVGLERIFAFRALIAAAMIRPGICCSSLRMEASRCLEFVEELVLKKVGVPRSSAN